MLSKDSSLKLYLISDFNDPNYAENLFGQIGDYNLSIVSSKEIIFEQKTPAIYIVQIFENESEILKKLLSLKNIRKDRFVFLISEYSINSITQLIRKGFTHFFLLPDEITHLQKFLIDELKGLDINFVSKYKSLNETNYILKTVFGSGDNANNKIAQTKEYASDRSINIIIEGEIGLGKTNLANTIHQIAKNNDHCLTELIYPYMDNEKFTLKITSPEKSFYKDLINDYELYEAIPAGTLIIREVNEMPLSVQKRLISNLNYFFTKNNLDAKFRVICTTSENLEQKVCVGQFDEELYYYLNMAHLDISPLRFRKDDIQNLFEHFVIHYSNYYNKKISRIESDVFDFLFTYPWPGNIQELKNTIQNSIILNEDNIFSLKSFNNVIYQNHKHDHITQPKQIELESTVNLSIDYQKTSLQDLSHIYTKAVLEKVDSNKSKASEFLGISRPTLQKILKDSN
ncbi:MAG: hypothetical protein CVV23_03625 [Ignavibacteriae bacterium HGW-Ignavibacteriae-2]|jgi:DNA-binding NtrC family response regulator|nr:MAG: hypothetical protein CVV23_03625 [Ignavibacteriae bacterium HGW-Ignavibacteriae-2]